MATFVRLSRNHASIGSLYSRFPARNSGSDILGCRRSASTLREGTTGSTAPSVVEPTGHGVNLGRFYVDDKRLVALAGWGYFEDGSVYLSVKPWGTDSDHAGFEANMRLLEPVVRQPPPQIQQSRSEQPDLRRLVFVDSPPSVRTSKSKNSCTVFVRNALDGERLSEEKRPFRRCHLSYDQPNLAQPSSTLNRTPIVFPYLLRLKMSRARQTFRGTFVGGILQPNVRLGNGLTLSENASLDRQRVLRGIQKFLDLEDAREAETKTSVPSLNTSPPVGFDALTTVVQGSLPSSPQAKAQSRSRAAIKHSASESQTQSLIKREAIVSKREAAVSKKEAVINAREAVLNKRYAAMYSKEASLSQRENSSVQKAAALTRKEDHLDEGQHALDNKTVAFNTKDAKIHIRRHELKPKAVALNRKEAQIIERQDALYKKMVSLNRKEAGLKGRLATLNKKTVAFGIERGRQLAELQEQTKELGSDYTAVFPELADSDPAEHRTRITLPQGPTL